MGFFTGQTRTVDLGDGNSITVRKLAFGDMQKLWSLPELYSGPAETSNQRFGSELTKLAIAAWDGPGFEGRGVSVDNINALPMEVINQVLPVAFELNVLSEDEKNG